MDHQSIISFDVSPTRTPILPSTLQLDVDIPSCFFIDFDLINTIFSSDPWDSNVYEETINHFFTIPVETLCNCTDRDHKSVVYNTFFFMSPNILDVILPKLEECARQMVAENREGREVLEMDLSIHISPIGMVGEENDQAQQIVGLMEKFPINYLSFDSATTQCSICLEGIYTKSELVSTKCSHVFHKECMVPWIQKCIDRSSSYSCPLCRAQMI
ncbi:RING/U-box superfamily protein [Trifolium repens]|nr:RING/U-box superfamily protein [Trifolium repens]